MKVVEVVPRGVHHVSGVVSSVVELAVALRAGGVAVDVLVPTSGEVLNEAARSTLHDAGVGLDRVDVASPQASATTRRPWDRFPLRAMLGEARAVVDRVVAAEADVVHLHNGFSPFNNVVAMVLGRVAPSVPYVVTTHGVYAPEGLQRSRAKKLIMARLLDRQLLHRAAKVTALTAVEAVEISAIASQSEIVELPLGFAPPAPVEPSAFRAELGIGDEALLAVYAGRFDVDHKRLVEVARGVAQTPGWHLALVGGDGALPVEIATVTKGTADRMHVVGPRYGPSFEAVCAAADVSILLSKSEGLPRAIVQAMRHGVPAIVSAEVDARLSALGSIGADGARLGGADPWWVAGPGGVGDALAAVAAADETGRASQARRWSAQLDWQVVGPRWVQLFEEVVRPGQGVPW